MLFSIDWSAIVANVPVLNSAVVMGKDSSNIRVCDFYSILHVYYPAIEWEIQIAQDESSRCPLFSVSYPVTATRNVQK